MEVSWALLFGLSLASTMLCPAARDDSCLSAGILSTRDEGSDRGQPTCVSQPGRCCGPDPVPWQVPHHNSLDLPCSCTRPGHAPLSPAACWLCRAWSSQNNLVWVQGLVLVGRRSLAWAGQEAGRKLCTSAAEQGWPDASPDNILARMGKN